MFKTKTFYVIVNEDKVDVRYFRSYRGKSKNGEFLFTYDIYQALQLSDAVSAIKVIENYKISGYVIRVEASIETSQVSKVYRYEKTNAKDN